MIEYLVDAPTVRGRLVLTEPGLFRGSRLLLDGQPLAKSGWGRFEVPRRDGTVGEAKLMGSFGSMLPAVNVDGTKYEVGPKLPAYLTALAFLPFVLIPIGGALGGLCGALGIAFNMQMARLPWTTPLKIGTMLGVCVLAGIVFVAVATAVHLAVGS